MDQVAAPAGGLPAPRRRAARGPAAERRAGRGAVDARGVPRQPVGPVPRHAPSRSPTPASARPSTRLTSDRAVGPVRRAAAATTASNTRRSSAAPSRRTSLLGQPSSRSSRTSLSRPSRSQSPAADVHPVPAVARLVLGVAVVVLAGQLQAEQRRPVAPDHQHRPVLALARVVLVGRPTPRPPRPGPASPSGFGSYDVVMRATLGAAPA